MNTFPEPTQWNGPDTREMHEDPEKAAARERAVAIDAAAAKLLSLWRLDEPVTGEYLVIQDEEFAWPDVSLDDMDDICAEAEDRTEYTVSFEPRRGGQVWCRRNGTGDDEEN